MVSESETKDFEVRTARTRMCSKLKGDAEADMIPIDTSNAVGVRHEGGENDETAHTERTKRRTRRGKRLSAKSKTTQNEAEDESVAPKKMKKLSDEPNEEGSDDVKRPKKPSNRQLKKEKAEQRETLKKEASRLEATEKALNYVSKWKHAKSEWKFEKLRQIWLMDNLLDEESIPDNIFPLVLEYFEGCKGMAREQLVKKGMDAIRKQEDSKEESTEETIESVEYKRARQLLQALPTEM